MAEADFADQLKALGDVMSARRYEMTDFEADAWLRVIKAVPRQRFLNFLSYHFASSPFAPQVSDATKHLDLAANPDVSFNRLAALVASVGPYAVPQIEDPVLVATIQNLGGWATVNEQLPDPSQPLATKAYRERFNACFNAAITQVRIDGQMPSEPLRAIGHVQRPGLDVKASAPQITNSTTHSQRP